MIFVKDLKRLNEAGSVVMRWACQCDSDKQQEKPLIDEGILISLPVYFIVKHSERSADPMKLGKVHLIGNLLNVSEKRPSKRLDVASC